MSRQMARSTFPSETSPQTSSCRSSPARIGPACILITLCLRRIYARVVSVFSLSMRSVPHVSPGRMLASSCSSSCSSPPPNTDPHTPLPLTAVICTSMRPVWLLSAFVQSFSAHALFSVSSQFVMSCRSSGGVPEDSIPIVVCSACGSGCSGRVQVGAYLESVHSCPLP